MEKKRRQKQWIKDTHDIALVCLTWQLLGVPVLAREKLLHMRLVSCQSPFNYLWGRLMSKTGDWVDGGRGGMWHAPFIAACTLTI